MRVLYTPYMLDLISTGPPAARLTLNPPLQRRCTGFKFKWSDDFKASDIKARIMDWRGRETV